MRPHQWHGAARRLARLKTPFGYRCRIPDLFRNEAARPGHPCHHLEIGERVDAEETIEVAALAGQQWPGATAATAVEGADIDMLAIALLVVAVIGTPVWHLHPGPASAPFQRVIE